MGSIWRPLTLLNTGPLPIILYQNLHTAAAAVLYDTDTASVQPKCMYLGLLLKSELTTFAVAFSFTVTWI